MINSYDSFIFFSFYSVDCKIINCSYFAACSRRTKARINITTFNITDILTSPRRTKSFIDPTIPNISDILTGTRRTKSFVNSTILNILVCHIQPLRFTHTKYQSTINSLQLFFLFDQF